ncbi:hypothetical protein BKK79_31695 [Cupriavidus sp. USMAA2-4]|uniref:Uncharacterized protein n=1 Tax=Cupriavidus malaysiensis TaxID=367825 RepID=A0ABM7D7Q9_9BURK|nr:MULTISPECIES: hypothetical protein [Cupriavidus]AOY96189.1 hypothetical protein BKK79_31695 [Cupriavidus sp. USMAA2-4]AOZ03409.1 hypothetical protein BKK81_30535 [Cupriavidus sp. USMAHM13]AOZ09229.1 hypothetical protein BKK80_25820 [Cupriavidus malaysiensis]
MERRFEYGGYAVLARAVPAGQGYLGLAVIADAFGEEASVPTHSQEVGVAPTAEAALALAEAAAMRAIDAGEVE